MALSLKDFQIFQKDSERLGKTCTTIRQRLHRLEALPGVPRSFPAFPYSLISKGFQ
ncbi:hypothetical protein PSP6_130013 [Paraburkholderia tropica]|nr:hypothetical protein PSP6_130013 [Paraburkholderia tropica]